MNGKLSVAFVLALPYGEAIAKGSGIPLDPSSLAGLIANFVVFALGMWLNKSLPALQSLSALTLMFLVSFGLAVVSVFFLRILHVPFMWAIPLIFCGIVFGSALLRHARKG